MHPFFPDRQYTVTVRPGTPAAAITAAATAVDDREHEPPLRASHSSDFASINWFGAVYTFSKPQRAVISSLWNAWREGHPFLSQDTLLEVAGSDGMRLRDVFKGNPAWGEIIQHGPACGGSLGTYRLVEPEE